MKKYATIGILGVLFFALLIIVFYILWAFRIDLGALPHFVHEEHNLTLDINAQSSSSWQDELAKWPKRDFTPAAEQYSLYFDADTSELKEKNKYFQLVISKYDIYSMFCLRQILNSFNVKYFLLKSGESPEIFLDTGNKGLIEDIIKELKKYKINTEVKEIWL